jgi:2-polyprenyl-6-methoxyphenol hydroxylase-like FAD-dependent oxidoreductase
MRRVAEPGPRAVVIGGSVAGLFVANILIRRNWRVDVFERVEEPLAARGAGIAWHDEYAPIMAAAGADDDAPIGIKVDARIAYDRFGTEIARYDYPQYLAAWGRVYAPLHRAFPSSHYHRGKELIGIDHGPGAVVARFTDGTAAEADLIVGADGVRSTVRSLQAPGVEPRFGGYVAWRGLIEEADLSATFRARTFEKFAFGFPPRGQFIGYPVPGRDDSIAVGQRRYNFLWYYHVEGEAALADLLTDETGHTHDYSIAPHLIRRAHIDELKRNAMAILPPQFAEAVITADRHLLQPIYDVETPRIGFDRVALVGDAAFVARPHVGVGVLKAGQDALALADSLGRSGSVAEALARYEQARLRAGREAVRFGRHLGSFIERGLPGPSSDPALELSPETIIRVSGRPVESSVGLGV